MSPRAQRATATMVIPRFAPVSSPKAARLRIANQKNAAGSSRSPCRINSLTASARRVEAPPLVPRRVLSGCDPEGGASAVPAGGLANRSRAVRASSPPALRPASQVLGFKRGAKSEGERLRVFKSREAWPGPSRQRSPCDESRSGAPKGERARKRFQMATSEGVARAVPEALSDGDV